MARSKYIYILLNSHGEICGVWTVKTEGLYEIQQRFPSRAERKWLYFYRYENGFNDYRRFRYNLESEINSL